MFVSTGLFVIDDAKVWGAKKRIRILIDYLRLYVFVNV